MDKYAVMEDTLVEYVKRLFKKLRRIDAEKRALEEENDHLRAREREAARLLMGWQDSGLLSDSKLAGDTDKYIAKIDAPQPENADE